MAQNTDGRATLGVTANDRITSYSDLEQRNRLSRRHPLHHTSNGIGWPSLLAIAMSVAGLITLFIAGYLYKVKNGLSCKPCMKKEDEDTEDADNVSLE